MLRKKNQWNGMGQAILFTGLLLLCVSSLTSIDKNLQKVIDPSLQSSASMKSAEIALDEKILVLYKRLQEYRGLMNVDVRYTPQRTKFTKDVSKGYIELESYSFIPVVHFLPELSGLRTKTMRLYFQGNNLSKVQTTVTDYDHEQDISEISTVVDIKPLTKENGDVSVTHQVNGDKTYTSRLGAFENIVSRPVRLDFKRKYYEKHLVYFEKLFRFTQEFQRQHGTGQDAETSKHFYRSLQY